MATSKPTDKAIVQPSARVFTQWTPSLIRAAFNNAESGNVRLAAELCDNMLADDRIGSVFETRVGGLLGLPLSFEASGDGRRRRKAVKALEVEEDWWAAFPEAELGQLLTWGRMLGVAFGQLHPTEHEGRFVPRLEFWHPKNTRYDWTTRQWFAKTDGGAREEPIVAGDGQWIVYAPYGDYRPWASGLWRGLARWWLLKSFAQDDAGRRSEKSGTGVVESPVENKSHELRKELATDIANAARDAVIVLPAGFKMSLLESRETIAQNQGEIVGMANIAMAVSVLGQNLTTEVGGVGSYAATNAHAKVENQRIKADAETASTVLHDQGLEWWAEFNFGDRSLAPWPRWQTDPPTDQAARATTLKTLGDAMTAFRDLGYEIDPEQVEAEFSVKLNKIVPPPVSPAQQTPPAQAAPAPAPNAQGTGGAEQPPTPPEPAAKAAGYLLRSGADASSAKGFIEGQVYSDALVDHGIELGTKLTEPTLAAVLEEVKAATSYDDLRKRLRARYADMSADEFADLMYRHMVIAQLAGRHAVNRDAN